MGYGAGRVTRVMLAGDDETLMEVDDRVRWADTHNKCEGRTDCLTSLTEMPVVKEVEHTEVEVVYPRTRLSSLYIS